MLEGQIDDVEFKLQNFLDEFQALYSTCVKLIFFSVYSKSCRYVGPESGVPLDKVRGLVD